MFITVGQLSEYTGVYPEENATMNGLYCQASCEVISNYLGYDPEEEFGGEVPALMKLVALQIASLMQAESENNIGITSKSFGDSGSRTFINYTNYDKWLSKLSAFRKIEGGGNA